MVPVRSVSKITCGSASVSSLYFFSASRADRSAAFRSVTSTITPTIPATVPVSSVKVALFITTSRGDPSA